jgi:hypothetical protein
MQRSQELFVPHRLEKPLYSGRNEQTFFRKLNTNFQGGVLQMSAAAAYIQTRQKLAKILSNGIKGRLFINSQLAPLPPRIKRADSSCGGAFAPSFI